MPVILYIFIFWCLQNHYDFMSSILLH
jgi:hypothetical protein